MLESGFFFLNEWPTVTANKTDHLHGVTLEALLNELVNQYGWKTLSGWVRINCFRSDPSIKSSLKFLRRTPWARAQVEAVFVAHKEGKDNQQISAIVKDMAGFSAKQKSPVAAKPGGKVNPWGNS